MLEQPFDLESHGASLPTELLAGLTTIATMAYADLVNPAIVAAARRGFGAVMMAILLVLECTLMRDFR